MGKFLLSIVSMMFLSVGIFLTAGTAYAGTPTDFGTGNGCEALGDVTYSEIDAADFFRGRINCDALEMDSSRGMNHMGGKENPMVETGEEL